MQTRLNVAVCYSVELDRTNRLDACGICDQRDLHPAIETAGCSGFGVPGKADGGIHRPTYKSRAGTSGPGFRGISTGPRARAATARARSATSLIGWYDAEPSHRLIQSTKISRETGIFTLWPRGGIGSVQSLGIEASVMRSGTIS